MIKHMAGAGFATVHWTHKILTYSHYTQQVYGRETYWQLHYTECGNGRPNGGKYTEEGGYGEIKAEKEQGDLKL